MKTSGEPGNRAFSEHWLVGGGEMGKLVRSIDWGKTPLGAIELWPQSLRTTVSLVLSSSFPISVAWGPKHTQIYNDGYWPICGEKHPHSMGQEFRECWASPWPVIGEAFERALKGETRFLENQWMFLDRKGYLEETCFTFSFSPIYDESGGIGGLFHPVTEVTAKLVSERRVSAVRDVMVCAAGAHSVEEALIVSAKTMATFPLDLPFALFYRLNPAVGEAVLVAASSQLPENVAPLRVSIAPADANIWPLHQVIAQNQTIEIHDLVGRFGNFECGPYPEPPKRALLIPISLPGAIRPDILLIAGASSRLPFDAVYRAFYDLLAGTIASAASTAFAYAEERKRAETLAEMDRAKTEFFSNVSHEFRTPLTLMLGPLEDELTEPSLPLPPDRHDRLETVHRNSLRLLRLVNTLLDFSRLEADRMQAHYEPTDLAAYTAELASNFRSAVEKGGLALVVECPSLPEPIYIDRQMWEKIVLNLLSNAYKHTFEGTIVVKLQWLEGAVELSVSDTGVGIAESEMPHLFERFHRVSNARSRTHEGTGIGLSLVEGLVKNHGGEIRVESGLGKGTTFFVNLKSGSRHLAAEMIAVPESPQSSPVGTRLSPRSIESAAHSAEALRWVAPAAPEQSLSSSADPNGKSSSVPSRARILWADDNADMRHYVLRLLASEYEVIAVPDGQAALDAALANPPDLVLTDVMMPILDGFGLLKALRADSRTRMVPVILLSARAGQEASLEGIAAGADDYLMKPFAARELMARIGTHLRAANLRLEWMAAIELRERRLARTSEELKRSNEELQQFAYIASHDLQEPLRTVTSFTQLLSRRYKGKLDSDADEFIDFAVDGCARMKRLIEDLLAYSRAGAEADSHYSEQVKTEESLEAALTNLRVSIEESNATVTYDPLPNITTDPLLLAQVFQNLVSNAMKYRSAADPRIHISANQSDGSHWIFSVTDNGLGIGKEHFDRIFVLFQRLQSREEAEGTGIGLSICKKIVERFGGKIWVQSEINQGSTFSFALPKTIERLAS